MDYKMRTINPGDIPTRDFHQYLLGCVAPRPIAFASTMDKEGNPNLAPYSFFNVFSSNPPTAVFSSNRRVSNNTTKDTLHNVQETGEVVINVVNYDIVRKMAVTSVTFPDDVNEFEVANLTQLDSELVKPYRVQESPAQMECKVKEIITLGDHGGAGHLIICDILRIHIRDNVIDGKRINPHKIDLMGRMGRAYYCRASGDAIHTVIQKVAGNAIGYNALPASAKKSSVLSANDVGMLCGLQEIPKDSEIQACKEDSDVKKIVEDGKSIEKLHELASGLLADNKREEAGAIVWYADTLNNKN